MCDYCRDCRPSGMIASMTQSMYATNDHRSDVEALTPCARCHAGGYNKICCVAWPGRARSQLLVWCWSRRWLPLMFVFKQRPRRSLGNEQRRRSCAQPDICWVFYSDVFNAVTVDDINGTSGVSCKQCESEIMKLLTLKELTAEFAPFFGTCFNEIHQSRSETVLSVFFHQMLNLRWSMNSSWQAGGISQVMLDRLNETNLMFNWYSFKTDKVTRFSTGYICNPTPHFWPNNSSYSYHRTYAGSNSLTFHSNLLVFS